MLTRMRRMMAADYYMLDIVRRVVRKPPQRTESDAG